ncbi:MAG: hypothetical protein ACJ8AI_22095 [Rhodopila sp.]
MMITRPIMAAAAIVLISAGGAFAGSSGRDAGAGLVSPPPPYPNRTREAEAPRAQNPYVPGATGRAVVPGTQSSIAGASGGTLEQKSGQIQSGQGGGGGR